MPAAIVTGLEEDLSPEDQAALSAEEEGQAPPEPEAQPEGPEGQPQAQIQTGPEAQAAAEERKPAKKKVPDVVAYDRFKEVNERAKAAEAQAADLREKWARLEERQRLAQEADQRMRQASEQAQRPQRPDPAIDPVGAELWDRDRRIEMLEQNLIQVQQGLGQTAQSLQQQAQFQDYQSYIAQDVNHFRMQKPDYDQRAQVATQKLLDFAKSVGAPEQEAQLVVAQLANFIASKARQNGMSAADAFYRFSEMVDPRGTVPAQQQAPSRAAETLRQVKEGQKFQGLSRVPAEGQDTKNWANLTAADIAEMSEDEFLARYQDPNTRPALEAAMRRLDMGV